MRTFTLDEKTAMSHGFSRGNYANAYESMDLGRFDLGAMTEHYRAAFVLGFFGTYTRDEMGSDVDVYDAAYWSDAGQYVVTVAKYTDERTEEYAECEDM